MPVWASVGDCDRSGADPDAASPLQALASPKSSTFTLPSGVTFTFAGLQVAVDDAVLVRFLERLGDLARDSIASSGGIGPRRSRSARSSPSTSSMARKRTGPAAPSGRASSSA